MTDRIGGARNRALIHTWNPGRMAFADEQLIRAAESEPSERM